MTYWRVLRLVTSPLPGRYDLDHLRAFHRALFADLYAWAGELRTVAIAKPGALFALPQHIETSARNVFAALASERHLTELKRDAFIERLAHYLGEVNALHPFREGNGRDLPAGSTSMRSTALSPKRRISFSQHLFSLTQ